MQNYGYNLPPSKLSEIHIISIEKCYVLLSTKNYKFSQTRHPNAMNEIINATKAT